MYQCWRKTTRNPVLPNQRPKLDICCTTFMFNKAFEKKWGRYVRSSKRHHADACLGAREGRIDPTEVRRRMGKMKVYFCGSIRGGRDDVEMYLRIVAKLQSFGTVLTEHVSKRELLDTGQSIPDTTIYCKRSTVFTVLSTLCWTYYTVLHIVLRATV